MRDSVRPRTGPGFESWCRFSSFIRFLVLNPSFGVSTRDPRSSYPWGSYPSHESGVTLPLPETPLSPPSYPKSGPESDVSVKLPFIASRTQVGVQGYLLESPPFLLLRVLPLLGGHSDPYPTRSTPPSLLEHNLLSLGLGRVSLTLCLPLVP